jgi:hypothetical protein
MKFLTRVQGEPVSILDEIDYIVDTVRNQGDVKVGKDGKLRQYNSEEKDEILRNIFVLTTAMRINMSRKK